MMLYKIAILPIDGSREILQRNINEMIEELFIEGWEFAGITQLTGREAMISFRREKKPSTEQPQIIVENPKEKEIRELEEKLKNLKSEPKNEL